MKKEKLVTSVNIEQSHSPYKKEEYNSWVSKLESLYTMTKKNSF